MFTIPTAHLAPCSVKPVSSLSVRHRSRRPVLRAAGFAARFRARIVDGVGMLGRQAQRAEDDRPLTQFRLHCTP